MRLDELYVSVFCDGQPLEEYRLEQQDSQTITCFIPSEAGKAFEIHTTNTSATQPVVGKLKLDGLKVRTFRAMASSIHVADCVYLSQSVRRPFLFSNTLTAHLEDEDYVRPEGDLMDSIGSIEIAFFRCELGPEMPWFSRGVKDISLGQYPNGYNAHQILRVPETYSQQMWESQPPRNGTEPSRGNMENEFMRAMANGQIAQHRRKRSGSIR
ncbi:hypothetical protein EIP86_006677 [Pleurotus ostreatoroseus]|nr:hypothetical protein EIP86_006677 [Pleurotus ostreatoroseus]